MIHDTRIRLLSNKPVRNRSFVLYWMQVSHRTEYNHALEYATIRANRLGKPLVVYFGLTEDCLTANERHYYFMLEGLREVQSSLAKRGIGMVVLCC